jgi:glycosyltransferase involved in cell wall biosynthesis
MASAMPLVSIITPSLNQGEFIEETIHSVLSQDYPRLEYIVVDGGSTDNTCDILRRYEGRLRWLSEKDRGQADAVNKGFRMARGEILGWLNSDDTYLPGAVAKAVQALLDAQDAMMVYGKAYYIDELGQMSGIYRTEPFDIARLAEWCFLCQPSVFLRSELFNHIEMLDVDLQYCMDYDLWIRIGQRFKIVYIDAFLANSRLYPGTKTLSHRDAIFREILQVVEKHYGFVHPNWKYGYIHHKVEAKAKRALVELRRMLPKSSELKAKGIVPLLEERIPKMLAYFVIEVWHSFRILGYWLRSLRTRPEKR